MSEQTGNIDINGVSPSDLSIELVTSSVSLSSLSTASDSTVKGITGALNAKGSSFQGDHADRQRMVRSHGTRVRTYTCTNIALSRKRLEIQALRCNGEVLLCHR